jgi:hypothetical protein
MFVSWGEWWCCAGWKHLPLYLMFLAGHSVTVQALGTQYSEGLIIAVKARTFLIVRDFLNHRN